MTFCQWFKYMRMDGNGWFQSVRKAVRIRRLGKVHPHKKRDQET